MTDEVLTETRDGVLVITINRPEAKNAINAAVAAGVAAALDELDARTTCGSACSPEPAAPSAPGWTSRPSSRASRRSSRAAGWPADPAAAAQAADRRRRGLGAGRRLRAHAGLRPGGRRGDGRFGVPEVKRGAGRRRRRGAAAARSGCRMRSRWRCCSPATRSTPRGPPSSAWSTGSCPRAARSTVRSSWPRTIAANGPLAVAVTKQIAAARADWTVEEGWAEAGRADGRRCSSPRTPRKARRRSPRSARRSGRAASSTRRGQAAGCAARTPRRHRR